LIKETKNHIDQKEKLIDSKITEEWELSQKLERERRDLDFEMKHLSNLQEKE